MLKIFFPLGVLALLFSVCQSDDPNRLPTKCETCKYVAEEISYSLMNQFNSFENIETGYNIDERLDQKKAKKKYRDSEVRFIEVIESVCDNILQYHVHAERSGSLRYARGESQTMGTLKGLVNRGVKVELGIPNDLWDTPSAEITQLKKYCENVVEAYEEKIEDWYFNQRDNMSLTDYLCENVILKDDDKTCLTEVFVPEVKEEEETKKDTPAKDKESKKTDL
jgi:hypothetical protein